MRAVLSFAALAPFLAAGENAAEYKLAESELVFRHTLPFAHSASIAEAKNGDLICLFFGGVGEKSSDTAIFISRKAAGGKEWTKPVEFANAKFGGERFASWNPVIFNDGGRLYAHYHLGDSPRTWRGFFRHSDDCGKTWSPQEALPDGVLGAIKNKPLRFGGKLVCPSSTEFHSSFGWRAHFDIFENGKWSRARVPYVPFLRAIQPAIVQLKDGSLKAFLRTDAGFIYQTRSSDALSWSKPEPTQIPNPCSGLDAEALPNGDIFLVCNPDKDSRRELAVFVSSDGGETFRKIFSDKRGFSQAYPSVMRSSDGKIHVVYSFGARIRHLVFEEDKGR